MQIPAIVTYDTDSNEVVISLASAEEEGDVELTRLQIKGSKPNMGHIADMHRRN